MAVKLDFDTYEETTGESLGDDVLKAKVEEVLMHDPQLLLMAVRDQYADAAKDLRRPRKMSAKARAEELSFANDLATAANYINMAINKMF